MIGFTISSQLSRPNLDSSLCKLNRDCHRSTSAWQVKHQNGLLIIRKKNDLILARPVQYHLLWKILHAEFYIFSGLFCRLSSMKSSLPKENLLLLTLQTIYFLTRFFSWLAFCWLSSTVFVVELSLLRIEDHHGRRGRNIPTKYWGWAFHNFAL